MCNFGFYKRAKIAICFVHKIYCDIFYGVHDLHQALCLCHIIVLPSQGKAHFQVPC